ncbi:alpha-tocopherol transfer protein-like [Halyomorpha halys]|uniref:alpha-tocopherol transfer protein-like n=1 Tax=Halyomorpha halys TaxID=286706 RepID=UPI0006D50D66
MKEGWKERCFKELGETEESRSKGLATLRRYISEHPEIHTDQTDEFLLRFLRARKFDEDRAFKLLKGYLSAKKRDPELFRLSPALEDVVHLGHGWQCVLSGRTKKGQAIFVSRPGKYNIISEKSKRGGKQAMVVEESFRTNVLALEWSLLEEMTQLAGLVCIIDMEGFSLIKHSAFLNPYHTMRTTSVVQDTLPLRFGGFHVVNQPRYMDAIYALFKPFLKEKIRERIYFHGRCYEQLHEFISPEVLPKEYGGTRGTIDDDDWKERLLADRERILAFEPPE